MSEQVGTTALVKNFTRRITRQLSNIVGCSTKPSMDEVHVVMNNDVHLQTQQNTKLNRPRLVNRSGASRVSPTQQPNSNGFRDWFGIIIELRWRYVCLIFLSGYTFSWLLFANLYWLLITLYNTNTDVSSSNTTCIQSVHDFASAFLFSVETQHTIGYGYRYVTTNCVPAIVLVCMQSIIGVFLQTILAGMVLAKFLRPKRHSKQIRFSEKACVCVEDGKMVLMFRVADMNAKNPIVEPHLRCYVMRTHVTREGDVEHVRFFDMDLGYDTGMDRVMLLWPITVRHVIDKHSPLKHYYPDLARRKEINDDFEILVTIEGIVEATGMTFQSRMSYMSSDICWGQRFVDIVCPDVKHKAWQIDYAHFNSTCEVNMENRKLDTESSSGSDSET